MAGFDNLGSWTSALTTGLNSLAAGSTATSSTITPPTSPRPFWMDLRINLASMTPSSGQVVTLHILQAVDSTPTNFADPVTYTTVAVVDLASGASTKEAYVQGLRCPVVDFKIALTNGVSGQTALGASGNTVEYRTYSEA